MLDPGCWLALLKSWRFLEHSHLGCGGGGHPACRITTRRRDVREPHRLEACASAAFWTTFHHRFSTELTHLINRNSLRGGCLQPSSCMHVDGTGPPSAREQPETI